MRYFKHIRQLYQKYVRDRDKEARFLVLIFFTLTFIVARLTVYSIRYNLFPFTHSIFFRDIHIHHLVFGIILLLFAGLVRIPREDDDLIRFSSILYGIGSALTLDEFAIWLRLNPDAYWGPEGRISIDAVVLFSLILFLTVGFSNFWQKLLDHTLFYFFIENRPGQRLWKKYKNKKKKWFFVTLGAVLIISAYAGLSIAIINSLLKPPVHIIAHKIPVKTKPTIPVSACSPTNLPASTSAALSTKPLVQATIVPAENGFCLNVPVLYYHHIQPWAQAVSRKQTSLSVDNGSFDQQMAYLVERGYHTINTEQLVQALQNHASLPPKSIAITIDDGYKDNYDYAFPILKKYNLIANLAIPTGLLGAHAATNDYFTWDELREMVNSGLIFADDHTWSHFGLGIGTADKNQFEIMTAKQQLEQYLGKPQTILVYPYGSYKPWIFPLLEKDGIAGAFTTQPGFLQCSSQIYALHRNRIANGSLTSYGL